MYGLSEESLTIVGIILIVVGVAMIGLGFEWNQDITKRRPGKPTVSTVGGVKRVSRRHRMPESRLPGAVRRQCMPR